MTHDLANWLYGRLRGVKSVPTGWQLVRLTDVARLESGHTPSRRVASYWNGHVHWLSLHDTSQLDEHFITETSFTITLAGIANSAARLLPAGTVALSRTATVGKCVILGREMATTQDFACYVPGPRVQAKFLMHLFRHMQPVWRTLAGGSTHQTVYMPVFERLQILLPPMLEQHQIAVVLDTLDEAIRNTEQLIAKLKQVKQGLLHDLLTRGIDDNGELRDPERHPEQFKESALGRIPKAWALANLATIAEVRSGIAKNSSRAVTGAVKVHYLRVANVQDGFLDLTEVSTIFVAKDDVERYRVLPGDVLMNEGGDLDKLGRGTVWCGEVSPCVHQNHVFVVRCGPQMTPEFLNAWTGSSSARRYFMVAGKQTTNLASINKTALGRLPVIVPPKAEQSAAVALLLEAQHQLDAENAELSKLGLLKAGLMEDLLTGRVRVTSLLEGATQ
jgi:type I restriction enzyme, S subunit